jgi:hypothetical protein
MKLQEFIIPIKQDSKINSAIIKANAFLLKKYFLEFSAITDAVKKTELLKSFWNIEFNGIVIGDWEFIKFKTATEKTMFLIRWS